MQKVEVNVDLVCRSVFAAFERLRVNPNWGWVVILGIEHTALASKEQVRLIEAWQHVREIKLTP